VQANLRQPILACRLLDPPPGGRRNPSPPAQT